MKTNSILILIIVMGIVFLMKPSHNTKPSMGMDKQPEEYMTGVFMTTYTETGFIKNELSANYWAYLLEHQHSNFTEPYLKIYKPDGSEWHIRAHLGQAKQFSLGSIEHIELRETVTLQRPQKNQVYPIHLATETLRYHPKKQYAESDDYVTMNKPGLQISGTGMRVLIEQNFVELLHNVKTHYVTLH